jgi:hypothetical protein
MPKREVLQRIILGRGVKTVTDRKGDKVDVMAERIVLKPGQVFDFTDEELKQIMATSPNAVTSKVTIDLDSEDAVRQIETTLEPNQAAAPAVKGEGTKGAKGGKAKAADSGDL